MAQGRYKDFSVGTQRYYQRVYRQAIAVHTLDKTSDEAVKIIKMLDISYGDKYAIENSLKVGDQIKFAKFSAEDLPEVSKCLHRSS